MDPKMIAKTGAKAALTIFAAQAADSLTGKKTGAIGILARVGGGLVGLMIGQKLLG